MKHFKIGDDYFLTIECTRGLNNLCKGEEFTFLALPDSEVLDCDTGISLPEHIDVIAIKRKIAEIFRVSQFII